MTIGFLFPGQGSQYVGMGKALFDAFESAREVYAEAEKVLGWDVAALCFEGPEAQLHQTEYTQPALLTASVAAWRALGAPVEHATAVAGHSLGEYTALVAAGALTFSDAVRIVHLRGRYMQEAVPEGSGAMAALIGLNREKVDALCREISKDEGLVAPANYNGPTQVVIAGERAAVEKAMSLALERGAGRAIRLSVSVPSHCPLMRDAALRLSSALDTIEGQDLKVPLINNVKAQKVMHWKAAREALVDQISAPLLWEESIQSMRDLGIDLFLEVGPGKVLAGLLKRIDRRAMVLNVEDPRGLALAQDRLKFHSS